MQGSLFLAEKVRKSLERLKAFEPAEGYYLAYSGGKDSVVLLRLAQMAGVKFDAHYNVTTVDPPELIRFIREETPEVIWERPRMSMKDLCVKRTFLPTRIQRFCCEYLKERGGEDRVVLTGIRWAESPRRAKQATMARICKKRGAHIINPIIDWSDEEVWEFIKQENIPYCGLYDENFKRLGCVGCPMAGPAGMTREFVRWPRFLKLYYRIAEKVLPPMLARRTEQGKINTFTTPREMILWWVRDLTKDQRHATVIRRLLDEMGLE
jgi:phosphoadenosine phosphosulfate reductase